MNLFVKILERFERGLGIVTIIKKPPYIFRQVRMYIALIEWMLGAITGGASLREGVRSASNTFKLV
ncbi:hypothetical protein [Dyella lutea]|uniref:Uncharacterized protein n=1 Tax=Dyella lutea TaxID=2950441 RepID=A0ABT1FDW8_9GAMM|nr:hypothetical protein [Dyella lutea]MCP1375305.1 hypothetical protein [Dyella lutea]